MRIYLAGIVLIGMLSAGCSSDWDPARAGQATQEGNDNSAKAVPTASLPSRNSTAAFASLPDRGELLRYSPDRKVKRSGAYTSHPIEISEAHALNAVASGELRLNAPDGAPVAVAFDHIEEQPDGNWTWVGGDETGSNAVLTFGEDAVFGEITSGGRSFRVTTRNGGAWLVETDHSMLAGSNRGQRTEGPDFLIPPVTAETDLGMAMAGSKVTAAVAATPKATATVVDLALGYTDGLVTKYGSQSVAITRITNLVALTNAAYQRSGVNLRVRLVKTVQVSYTDNSTNEDTLEKLTGYDASTRQSIPTDPAFAALRAARTEFGADLVSLIRPHRSPEQDGCGIAWLLGANGGQGGRGIVVADAPFGYSVVSEGDDVDEGDNFTYFCSDNSLAHELGHSMGQAHNQADAEYAGVHAYSYGYRETSTSGFYTIMAYPIADSSQVEVSYFANPSVTTAGRPTGVANAADNVRSMNLTMPIVANFLATVVPIEGESIRNDVNGDGKSDLLFRHLTSDAYALWFMNGYSTRTPKGGTQPAAYTLKAIGDFDGNGRAELLWTSATRDLVFTRWNGSVLSNVTSPTKYAAGFAVVGAADVDGNGTQEVVLHNASTNQFSIWFLDADFARKSSVAGTTPNYHYLAATADFDGDGREDLLWTSAARNLRFVSWKSGSGLVYNSTASHYIAAGFRAVGGADVNGDGKSEVIVHNSATGQFSVWFMTNFLRSSSKGLQVPIGYNYASVGDFSGAGSEQVMWTNSARNMLFTIWNKDNVVSTLNYAAGYRVADGP